MRENGRGLDNQGRRVPKPPKQRPPRRSKTPHKEGSRSGRTNLPPTGKRPEGGPGTGRPNLKKRPVNRVDGGRPKGPGTGEITPPPRKVRRPEPEPRERYIFEEDDIDDDTMFIDGDELEELLEDDYESDVLGDSLSEDTYDDTYYNDDEYYAEEYFDEEDDGYNYNEDDLYDEDDIYEDDEYYEDYDEEDYGDDYGDDEYYDGEGSGGKLTENPWFIVVLTLGVIVTLVVTYNIGKSRGVKKGREELELEYRLEQRENEELETEDDGEYIYEDEEEPIEDNLDVEEVEEDEVVEEDLTLNDTVDNVVDDVKDEVKEKVEDEVDKAVDEGLKVVDDVTTDTIKVVKETIDLSKFEEDVNFKIGDIVDNKGTIVQALSVDELVDHEAVKLKKDKFIEVGVLLQNSTEDILKYGADQFKIVDGDGKTHKPNKKFYDLEGYIEDSVEVEPGMEIRGKVVFEVPDSVESYTLVVKSKTGLVLDTVKIALK